MSSQDGSRSARQSKRYSMSALYMSMSANEGDLQIEDDLARGMLKPARTIVPLYLANDFHSPKGSPRTQVQDFVTVEEELRA